MDMDVERMLERGDEVLAVLMVTLQGRGSGVGLLESRIAQQWTLRDGKLLRMRLRVDAEAAVAEFEAAGYASLCTVFDTLSDRLQAALGDVRSRGKLTEDDVNKAMRQVRLALLEADVNFKVVKQFTDAVKERALGPGRARRRSTRASRS